MGLLVCFDIDFYSPVQQMVDAGIRDFAYSSWWVNTPPLGSATMVQQAWSRTLDVNLIASNIGQCPSSCGSGIYQSGAVLTTAFSDDRMAQEAILVGTFHRKERQKQRKRRLEVLIQTSVAPTPCLLPSGQLGNCVFFIPEPNTTDSFTVTNGSMECALQVEVAQVGSQETWALAAYDGYISYGASDPLRTHMCTLIHADCLVKQAECGFTSQVVFAQLTLQGSFKDSAIVLPMLALTGGHVLRDPADQTKVTRSNHTTIFRTSQPLEKPLFNMQLTSFVDKQ
jgi:hypothetical protein